MIARTILLSSLLFVLAAAKPAASDERGFTTSAEFTGQLMSVDGSWSAVFSSQTPMPRNELVYWGHLAENEIDPVVLLSDGSALVGTILAFIPERLTIGSDPGTFRDSLWKAELPSSLVCGAVLRSLPDLQERDHLVRDVIDYRGDKDVVWLANGDKVEGQLLTSQLQGRGGQWSMQAGSGTVEIEAENVLAIALGDQRDNPPQAEGVIGFRDGSTIRVIDIKSRTTDYEFTLACGVKLSVDMGTFTREVCYYRPPNDSVLYLSDLKAVGYRHIPYLTVEWPYYTDRSVMGTRLRLNNSIIEKGLGVHSISRLAYDIPPDTRRFQAELALDLVSEHQGSVVYRVYLQPAEGEWQAAFESRTIRGDEPPQILDLDVGSARRIALIVDVADQGDTMDRANWLMARFVK